MAKKSFMNVLVDEFPLDFIVKADVISKKVNGKVRHNFVIGDKAIWAFTDKNGQRRFGIEPVKEHTAEQVE